MHRALLSWSSGKDSEWALHVLLQQPDVEVVGLVTTSSEVYSRTHRHEEGA
jgi:diphthamide synthase (EF-2-diphthine--ammonia ligase)